MTMTKPAMARWDVDFSKAPFLVIWETTRACGLACQHCRASADSRAHPDELTSEEGRRLVDEVSEMGTPLLVFSGGDPTLRDDLFELIGYAKERGLRVATIPAATPRLTEPLIEGLKDAGLDQVAFSLDFPRAELHDGFRGSPGAFARTLEAIGWAHKHGLPPQINTCVWARSAPYLQEMADLVEKLGAVFWEVFFLVPMGRGTSLSGLSPDECENLFPILMRAQMKKKFILKVTEAPHYRRFLRQHHERENGRVGRPGGTESVPLAQKGVNAGNGFLFVSHVGDVYPSGFLPVSAGNVRESSLTDLYRESPLFLSLRDTGRLKGRCGRCLFKAACGGSRSRAYALTGDWLETDPWCAYEPCAAPAPSAPSS